MAEEAAVVVPCKFDEHFPAPCLVQTPRRDAPRAPSVARRSLPLYKPFCPHSPASGFLLLLPFDQWYFPRLIKSGGRGEGLINMPG